MLAITLHQPWATLVALGVKRYETRSWRPPRHLIGQRHIPQHAQTPTLFWPHSGPHKRLREDNQQYSHTEFLPLRAVVCTAILGEPILCGTVDDLKHDHGPIIAAPWTHPGLMLYPADLMADAVEITDQADYGDFSPGRWAWPLTDIELWIWCPGNGLAPCAVNDKMEGECGDCGRWIALHHTGHLTDHEGDSRMSELYDWSLDIDPDGPRLRPDRTPDCTHQPDKDPDDHNNPAR